MQFSLNAFDPTAKKLKFKITIVDGTSKNIFFRDAFSEAELKELYPDASEIRPIEKNISP
jgi:hypothetical protein